MFSIHAQQEPTSVDKAGFRIENIPAIVFRTMLAHPTQDDQTDYRHVFPIA
jgi:hypothetical protein